MFTTAFLKGAAERAVKTFAQALLAVIGVGSIGFADIDWQAQLSVAGLAALASLLTSLINPSFTAGADQDIVIEQIEDPDLADDTPGKHAADAAE